MVGLLAGSIYSCATSPLIGGAYDGPRAGAAGAVVAGAGGDAKTT